MARRRYQPYAIALYLQGVHAEEPATREQGIDLHRIRREALHGQSDSWLYPPLSIALRRLQREGLVRLFLVDGRVRAAAHGDS